MKFENIGVIVIGIIIAGLLTYGAYWIGKTISYKIFYEDMVSSTVTDLVKPECLAQ